MPYIQTSEALIDLSCIDAIVLDERTGYCQVYVNGSPITIEDYGFYEAVTLFMAMENSTVKLTSLVQYQDNMRKIVAGISERHGPPPIMKIVQDPDKFIKDMDKQLAAVNETQQMNFQFGMEELKGVN